MVSRRSRGANLQSRWWSLSGLVQEKEGAVSEQSRALPAKATQGAGTPLPPKDPSQSSLPLHK